MKKKDMYTMGNRVFIDGVQRDDVVMIGDHLAKVVDRVPVGYQIWNVDPDMAIDLLPLCQMDANYYVDTDTLLAIRTPHSRKILDAAAQGGGTLQKMTNYVRRYDGQGGILGSMAKMVKAALPLAQSIDGL